MLPRVRALEAHQMLYRPDKFGGHQGL
jgi:hypothetical protein